MKDILTKYNWCYFLILILFTGILNVSCESDELHDPSFDNVDNELDLTVSNNDLELQEKFINNAVNFNWSTGTNNGTNSAITYSLSLAMESGNYSEPLIQPIEDEKNIFLWDIDYGTLNNLILENGGEAGEAYSLKAKVTATVAQTGETQTSETNFTVKTYKPVSNQLYIFGDATPNGWDIANAIALNVSNSQRGVFTYEGSLTKGNFKFAVSQDNCFCQDFYTKDPDDDSAIIYNEGGSGDDIQWTVTEEGNYRLRVDLLNKTISIEPVEDAPFPKLWIAGDATESGWNVENPAEFTQSEEDPFIFTYKGNFKPGEFKVFAGPLGDFCGEWYRPFENGQTLINGEINQSAGCDQDNKWLITEETAGRYRVTLNTADNTIRFEQIKIYIVGDGSPSGWDIETPMELSYDNGDFVFNGELGMNNPTGEFKFSNQKGDWCGGEWVNPSNASQSIEDSNFIRTIGCEGPDNKWKLQDGDAGAYEIRINLDTETMTITPQ